QGLIAPLSTGVSFSFIFPQGFCIKTICSNRLITCCKTGRVRLLCRPTATCAPKSKRIKKILIFKPVSGFCADSEASQTQAGFIYI
ncbi:MAG TPA: hypothetical protein PKD17_05210, partial [Cellvibrionaceae bacterium]|nr:hypothetical protein [Cellvibrionaceae bacterium]